MAHSEINANKFDWTKINLNNLHKNKLRPTLHFLNGLHISLSVTSSGREHRISAEKGNRIRARLVAIDPSTRIDPSELESGGPAG